MRLYVFKNAISATLKNLGENGACKLQMLLPSKNAQWLHESGLKSIMLDADSTVKLICGNQEGAVKGFNTTKKGANSCHPLLIFVCELELLYHAWLRTGSAYTANGIVDFLKEVKASLPKNIKNVFPRADRGLFSGGLFDSLESFCWDYLVRVKQKNLEKLLQSQTWTSIKEQKDVAICEFSSKTNGWAKPRLLKAMRSVKEYVQAEYLGQQQIVPVTSTCAMQATLIWMPLGYMNFTSNARPANFAMRETNAKLVLIGERRSKICKAKHGSSS